MTLRCRITNKYDFVQHDSQRFVLLPTETIVENKRAHFLIDFLFEKKKKNATLIGYRVENARKPGGVFFNKLLFSDMIIFFFFFPGYVGFHTRYWIRFRHGFSN